MPEHEGPSHIGCPACKEVVANATSLQKARVRKVYGKVSANARREYSANQRQAKELFNHAYTTHQRAIRKDQQP